VVLEDDDDEVDVNNVEDDDTVPVRASQHELL
jgi:hypothetical protein